jgi:hypothetical protein
MNNFYEKKAQKYKLKYFNLLNQSGGYTSEEEEALVIELTNSTPIKAKTILANITDVEYIQKIYDKMGDNNNNQIEIVFKIMQERILELYIHKVQNKNIESHIQNLQNIELGQQIINSEITRLRRRAYTSEHTELVTVENIMIQLSPLLNEVNTEITRANEALDVLKKGEQLYLIDIQSKQGIIEYREQIIKIRLETAQNLVNKGLEIVMKIEQERQTQISKSAVGQKLLNKKSTENLQSVQLKTRI